MKIKQSVLAASITAALAMGAAGEAAATVYAGSRLDISALTINITPAAQADANIFNFSLANTAFLAGAGDAAGGACAGNQPNNGSCGGPGGPLVLDANPANAPGGAPLRGNNDMTFFGPGGNYSNSDSVIRDAQLVGDVTGTDTDNVAEASLDTLSSASANAEIRSVTGFTFDFTVAAPGDLTLAFLADPDMQALITALDSGGTSANLNTSFTLQQNTDDAGGTLGFANWNPQGTPVNDCTASGGVTCVEDNDSEDLNISIGTTTGGTTANHSFAAGDTGFGDNLMAFGITVGNLDAGSWTLSLNEVKSVNLTNEVPEPGILALVGIGLMGLGMSSLRKKRV